MATTATKTLSARERAFNHAEACKSWYLTSHYEAPAKQSGRVFITQYKCEACGLIIATEKLSDQSIVDDYQTGKADFFSEGWDAIPDGHLRVLQDKALAAITERAHASDDRGALSRIDWHSLEFPASTDTLKRHRMLLSMAGE